MYTRSRTSNYLFSSGDLGATLREHILNAIRAVGDIAEDRFKHQPDAEIAQELLQKFSVRPLELLEQRRTMTRSEVKIDVSRSSERNPFRRPGPIHINGIRVVVSTPFLGDPGDRKSVV